jgi:hypothetical protein
VARHSAGQQERPTLTVEQRIYLAGIVDGEGCIGVFTRGHRKDWMRPHLQVTNTSLELLAWLRGACPLGTVVWRRDKRPSRKSSWCWRLACDQAIWLLDALRPWLVVKAAQADAVLALAAFEQGRVQRGVLTDDVRQARVVCFDQIQRLNYRARYAA